MAGLAFLLQDSREMGKRRKEAGDSDSQILSTHTIGRLGSSLQNYGL